MDNRSVIVDSRNRIGPYVTQPAESVNFLKVAAIRSIEGGCSSVGAVY